MSRHTECVLACQTGVIQVANAMGLKAQFQELVTAGVMAADPAEREQIYFELQELYQDNAIQITLSQQAGSRYENRWVKDWFFRVGQFGGYFYGYDLAR